MERLMTSSNGNIFRVTGPWARNWPVTGEFPTQRPVTRSFDVFLNLARTNGWVTTRDTGDLRRHRTHYGVTVMVKNNGGHSFAQTTASGGVLIFITKWCAKRQYHQCVVGFIRSQTTVLTYFTEHMTCQKHALSPYQDYHTLLFPPTFQK